MARLPVPGQDTNNWGTILNDFLSVSIAADGTLKLTGVMATKADDSAVLHLTGNEVVSGTKTFNSSPAVPTPTLGSQAANKTYVDSVASSGAPDATASTNGVIRLTGDLGGTAASPTVPGLSGKATDTLVVHLAGSETITGAKNFTGGLTVNAAGVVVTSDTRLTDTRTPTDGTVTDAKIASAGLTNAAIATAAGIVATKLSSAAQTSLGKADSALQPGTSTTGDLSGTYSSTTVAKVNGVAITGTPSNGYLLTATSASAASWQAPSGGGGGISRSIVSVSGNTSAGSTASTDYVYIATAALTLTLPTAVGNTNSYTIKNTTASSSVTVDTTLSQTIDGSATIAIDPRRAYVLYSDNANWIVT